MGGGEITDENDMLICPHAFVQFVHLSPMNDQSPWMQDFKISAIDSRESILICCQPFL
jgi:hypothetical protein